MTVPGPTPARQGMRTGALRLGLCIAVVAAAALVLDVGQIAAYVDGRLLLAILALQVPVTGGLLVIAYRHAWLIARPPPPFRHALASVVLANTFSLVMPARLSEVIKATYLRKHAGIPLSQGVATVVVERMCDLAVVAAIAAWALGTTALNVGSGVAVVAPAAVVMATYAIIRWHSRLRPLVGRLPGPLRAFVLASLAAAQARSGPRELAIAMLLTVIAWTAYLGGALAYFAVQPVFEVAPTTAVLVFVASLLAAAIPGLPSGFGAYEAAVGFILVSAGATWEQGIALGLGLHVAQVLLSVVIALPVLLSAGTGVSDTVRDALQAARTPEIRP